VPYSLRISSYNLTFVDEVGTVVVATTPDIVVVVVDDVFDIELTMLVEEGVDEDSVDDVEGWDCCWLLLLPVELLTELAFVDVDDTVAEPVVFVWLVAPNAPPLKQSAISTDSASPYLRKEKTLML